MIKEPYSMRRQRVNLTAYAKSILENDRLYYFPDGQITCNRFYNSIISGFYQEASASINQQITKLEKAVGYLGESHVAAVRKQLQEKQQQAHPMGNEGLLFSLYKENDALLYGEDGIKESKNYRKGVGGYLKALFEEFAQLPQSHRESIYFADRVTCVQRAVQTGQALLVTTANGTRHWVRPSGVLPDGAHLHLYLIGFSRREKQFRAKEKIASFRISNITISSLAVLPVSTEEKVFILSSAFGPQNSNDKMLCLQALRCVPAERQTILQALGLLDTADSIPSANAAPPEDVMRALRGASTLSTSEKREIAQKIRQVDVPYLVGKERIVRIRLTPEGEQLYRSKSLLRPPYSQLSSDGIYTFTCSTRQIQNYFLAFGKNAVVIEPDWLRESFRNHHQAALDAYKA